MESKACEGGCVNPCKNWAAEFSRVKAGQGCGIIPGRGSAKPPAELIHVTEFTGGKGGLTAPGSAGRLALPAGRTRIGRNSIPESNDTKTEAHAEAGRSKNELRAECAFLIMTVRCRARIRGGHRFGMRG
jgi:hypothetical protein